MDTFIEGLTTLGIGAVILTVILGLSGGIIWVIVNYFTVAWPYFMGVLALMMAWNIGSNIRGPRWRR